MDLLVDAEVALSSQADLATRNWRDALFKVLNCEFSCSSAPTLSYYVLRCVESCVRTLHLISLLYSEQAEFSGWTETRPAWELLAFTRIDKLCVYLGFFRYWVYVVAALVFGASAVLLLLVYQQYRFDSFSRRFAKYGFLLPTWAVARLLYLPALCSSAALLKYSLLSTRNMPEYRNLSSTELESGSTGFYFGWVGLGILALGLLEALFLFHISLLEPLQQRAACAHSTLQLIEWVISTSLVVLHFSLQEFHWIASKSISLVLCALLAGLTMWYLPFYHLFFNYLLVARFGLVALASLCFIVGLFLDDATVTLSLFLVLALPALYFLRYGITKRLDLLISTINDKAHIVGLYEKEFALRWQISQLSPHDKPGINRILLEYADFASTSSKRKIVVIWETHFCLDFLQDERLSRIKLAKALNCASSLWEDFQEFQLRERLSTDHCDYHEEVDFVNYQTLLERAKKYDEQFCFLLLNFWSEVSSRALVWGRMERLITRIDLTLKELKHIYEDLTKKYPKSPSGLRLFGTFLRDLCNDRIKADNVLKKAETELQLQVRTAKSEQYYRNFTYFNETNGLLIVSGASRSFGIVTFANLEAAHTLGYPSVATLVGVDVNQLVPPPFYQNHHDHMRKFLDKCSSPVIELPFTVFMKKMNGNIIEVYTSMKCTALSGHPFFIVALRARSGGREIALLSPERRIYAHTDGFPEAVLGDYVNLQGKSVEDIIPFFSEIKAAEQLFTIFKARSSTRSLNLMMARSVINRVNIDILIVFTEKAELMKWKLGEGFREKQELTYSAGEYSPVSMPSVQPDLSMASITVSPARKLSYAPIPCTKPEVRAPKVDSTCDIKETAKSEVNLASFNTIMHTLYARKAGSSSHTDFSILRKANQALRLLTLVLLALTVLLIAFSLGVLIYIQVYIASLEPDAVVTQVLVAPYDFISLSDLARDTDLLTQRSSGVWAEIAEGVENHTQSLIVLKTLLVDGSNRLAVFLHEEQRNFLTWSRRSGVDTLLERHIEEALGEFISNVTLTQGLAVSQSLTAPSLSSPSLYYLYRNGLSDPLTALNHSLSAYLSQESEYMRSFRTQLLLVCCLFVCVFLLCCSLLIPVIVSIQRATLGVWAFFFDMQLAQVLEAKSKCLDRLEREHGHDLSLTLNSSHLKSRFQTEGLKTKLQMKLPREWWALAWKLVLLLVVSVGFYLGVNALGSRGVVDSQQDYVNKAEELMTVRNLFRLGGLWLKEQWARPSYLDLVTSGQIYVSSLISLEWVLMQIQMRRSELFQQFVREGRDQYQCITEFQEFSHGLHACESLTMEDFVYLAETEDWKLLKQIRAIIEATGACQLAQVQSLRSSKASTLALVQQVLIGATAGYCLLVSALYLCLYRPSIQAIGRRIKKVWKLSKLIVSRY